MSKGLHLLYKKLLDAALESNKASADVIRRILAFIAVSLQLLSVL